MGVGLSVLTRIPVLINLGFNLVIEGLRCMPGLINIKRNGVSE